MLPHCQHKLGGGGGLLSLKTLSWLSLAVYINKVEFKRCRFRYDAKIKSLLEEEGEQKY